MACGCPPSVKTISGTTSAAVVVRYIATSEAGGRFPDLSAACRGTSTPSDSWRSSVISKLKSHREPPMMVEIRRRATSQETPVCSSSRTYRKRRSSALHWC